MEVINKELYLTTRDIAKLFGGVHIVTIYRWEKMGYFKADFKNFQGHKLYSLENVEKHLIKRFGEKYGKIMYSDMLTKINEQSK